jgi:hypothetical protein
MDYFQRDRRDSLDPITSPIQAKEKASGGGGTQGGEHAGQDELELDRLMGRDPQAAGREEGDEVEGAGDWNADDSLMAAMGLGDQGGQAGAAGAEGGDKDGGRGQGGTARSAMADKKQAKKKKRGAPKGESRVPGAAGAEGAGSGGAAGATPVQRKGLGEVGDLLGGRGEQTQAAALGSLPSSGGAPVDRGIASGVEKATGQSVGDVRVHTDDASAAAANSISARAFTSRNNIHMGADESPKDAKLMSHELAHTIQQTQGAKVMDGVSAPGDSLEVEADRIADAALSGGSAPVTVAAGGGTLMRDAVSDVEKLLSYGAFDWAVTDDEATQALGILAAMPAAQLGPAIARLGQTYKTRLLENLPEAAKRTSGYTKVLVALGPDAVLPYLQGLLSYGVFDWAVTDSDAAAVFQIIRSLSAAQQATMTTKLGVLYRSRLSSNLKRVSVIGPEEYAVLRVLFDGTGDAEIATLCNWTALRFNLKVTDSTDSAGTAWDKRGLRRCWDVLAMLPPEHIESNGDLKSLTRYRSGSIEGWASDEGEAAIGYGDGNDIDNTNETGAFTDAGDPLRGTNMFDATVRHEIGHRVDSSVGGPAYCATDDGGGWLTWDSTDGIADRLVTASAGKISSWANADQKRAIIACLQTVVADRAPTDIGNRLRALPFLSNHASDAAQATMLADIEADGAVLTLSSSFSNQGPWSGTGIHLGDRVYHESYAWPQWVSYKHAARAKKMSTYQFRAPGEWFAEAYAAYYQPPGAKGSLLAARDPATKAWFDANVDPQHGAGGTTPPAPGAAPAPGPGAAPAPAGP